MSKKRILCFGDSYVWGYIPDSDHERFGENIRFPKVLQKLLGRKYEIIEEGLISRTLVSEDKRVGKEGRNGSQYLIPCLDSHDPIDFIVLMLGTNELKASYRKTTKQIGKLLEKYFVNVILKRRSQFRSIQPKLILVVPPVINEKTDYAKYYVGGTEKSKQFKKVYSQIAKSNNCLLVDASDLKVGSDGVHFDSVEHLELAKRLAEKIKTIAF